MTEAQLHKSVCNYLKLQYPDIIFTSESSGVRLTIGQAKAAKSVRSDSGLPDLMIFEPMGVYKGLFIELKKDSVWLKDGTLTIDKHVREQSEIMKRLRVKGYFATFACSFDEAKELIDWYLQNRRMEYDLNYSIELGAKVLYLDTI
jgi:hypothetical protein